ncbi:MAG: hypothetical protein JXA54_17130 [Candidatus Heimdallarchaeota archaeon]|nr:hypothetical protein [Candidatus Heimdallarchaeota archaeon]
MAIKEAKDLELLPRLSANEKRIFSTLSNYGASTITEIADRGKLSKGRIPAALEAMIQRGLIVQLKTEERDPRYAAIFPINRFMTIINKLINSLESRKSELEATAQVVNDFTENAIKNVRDASLDERQKRSDRSEEDIKDLEMAMDASFSGILASVEMDLKDLSKIAQTSNEFLAESSIRTDETCFNIRKSLAPLRANFSEALLIAQNNAENHLEATVDARVADVLDFEANANRAFEEILDAFKDSQEAFENIIFTVLDTGIEDLEKVTRPINEQIEEAINSLKLAIDNASINFQTEIVRVLIEQKRPMITTMDGLRPKASKILIDSQNTQNDFLDQKFNGIVTVLESHTTLFNEAIEHLAKEFDRRVTNFIEHIQENVFRSKEEIITLETRFSEEANNNLEEKFGLIHLTSNKTRDVLSEMTEQFTIILNRSVAQYQMDLSDLVAKLENEFLSAVENNGVSVQNLVTFINMSLTEPVKVLLRNLTQLNEKIRKDEAEFSKKFEDAITKDLQTINMEFSDETKKYEVDFEKEVKRLQSRFDKEIQNNHDLLLNRLNTNQKNLQALFKNFSDFHEKELRSTSKDISIQTKKLERWRGESVDFITNKINERVNKSMLVLGEEIDQIIKKVESIDSFDKNEMIKIVKDSQQDITKSFKGFGNNIGDLVRKTLDDIADTLKKDSLSIHNRLVDFKKEQDKLVEETKRPSIKMIKDISEDYTVLNKNLVKSIDQLFVAEFDSFKRSRKDLGKTIENILNRRNSRSSKDIVNLQEVFIKARENYIKKTQDNFEQVEKTINKDTSILLDQEKNSRITISSLTEQIVSDLSNGVNATAERLRINLGEGSESIFSEATAEINKQEIELNTLNDTMKNEVMKSISALSGLVKKQIDESSEKASLFQEKQIGDVYNFKKQFTQSLTDDLTNKVEELNNSRSKIKLLNEKLTTDIKDTIDTDINKTIQELEVKTAGIEGAIFSTVENIAAESSRRTDRVAVIGEQAVLGIEDRYTENLESIRQSLTDEVISRIESEAKRIENYKGGIREIGKQHLKIYGEAINKLNNTLKTDLANTEKISMKTFTACEGLSCKFLEELNAEISAMSGRVGFSTERLTSEMLDDFDRVFQKVKREATLFARKQFELSNKSNFEIAETFQKSVDDLEEVIRKQITSISQRTSMAIDRTKEVSDVIRDNIRDITETFTELND